ncbi:hypothetical protein PRK78_002615 [Emydomyces testavorans]|uniref:Amine oxidase domain-containing protein n=1 Tax=Emydomyces testavorans TaxID=2070801 RepID=A0AAF0DFE4_9EURO|nr:hypothetical protein PRK78_002615 [Emydomyces testavorans]
MGVVKAEDAPTKTVAVVGTGMAGLVTAYLLRQDKYNRFDVEVFEAQDQCSFDSASVTVSSKDGTRTSRVDQPMRAFDRGYYANLTAMYDYLDVRYHQERFFFSFARLPSHGSTVSGSSMTEPQPYFIHSSNNHRIPPMRPEACGMWTWLSETVYLAFCLVWFTVLCLFVQPKDSRSIDGQVRHCESLEQYLRRIWIPKYFIKSYLLPGLASISTCTHAEMLNFPAKDVIDYKIRSLNSPHLRVSGGVSEVQKKLCQGLTVHFNCRVTTISQNDSTVRVLWESPKHDSCDGTSNQKTFDHVILAVPPNVVGSIFAPLKSEMSHIPTAAVESIIHTDIPATGQQHSHNALYQLDSHPVPPNWIHFRSSTHLTEAIHEDPETSVIVTNFPTTPIDPSKIISRTHFTRTLRTPRSRDIVNRIFDPSYQRRSASVGDESMSKRARRFINGDGNVWLVGSWCWDGMVLLEGCVVSATRVAGELGVEIPWRTL